MLSDGYKQPEIEMSPEFGAKCLLAEQIIAQPRNQYPIRSGPSHQACTFYLSDISLAFGEATWFFPDPV